MDVHFLISPSKLVNKLNQPTKIWICYIPHYRSQHFQSTFCFALWCHPSGHCEKEDVQHQVCSVWRELELFFFSSIILVIFISCFTVFCCLVFRCRQTIWHDWQPWLIAYSVVFCANRQTHLPCHGLLREYSVLKRDCHNALAWTYIDTHAQLVTKHVSKVERHFVNHSSATRIKLETVSFIDYRAVFLDLLTLTLTSLESGAFICIVTYSHCSLFTWSTVETAQSSEDKMVKK